MRHLLKTTLHPTQTKHLCFNEQRLQNRRSPRKKEGRERATARQRWLSHVSDRPCATNQSYYSRRHNQIEQHPNSPSASHDSAKPSLNCNKRNTLRADNGLHFHTIYTNLPLLSPTRPNT